MRFTFNWLKEFVELDEPPQRIAERLTMAGFEVESLKRLRDPQGREDWLFEVAVTPNRGDCLGILGLAREVVALKGGKLKLPAVDRHTNPAALERLVKVEILNPDLCPRYSARVVDEIQVALSPPWMRFRLEECGIRSISNVVDITNYVMLETGQPLHAFDLDRLPSRRIVVRAAQGTKRLVTLDGVERDLSPEDLLICDGDEAIALAGIMGGEATEVHLSTRRVLLESANFDPVTVRRTAKRLGIHTEASHRFERGVDPGGTLFALDRAVFLLREICGARAAGGFADRYPGKKTARPLLLRHERVRGLLGLSIGAREAEKILRSLGLKVVGRSKGTMGVLVPSHRRDLTREADLIEEIARIYGYEKIPSTLPSVKPLGSSFDPCLRQERKIRFFLIGEGMTELINLPFISGRANQLFCGLWDGAPVAILNPLTQENAELRRSLLPGMIENLRFNLAQKAKSFHGFQLGKVFFLDSGGSVREREHIAGILYGPRERAGLRTKESSAGFLDLKGLVEGILQSVGIEEKVVWSSESIPPFLHPGKAAALKLEDSPAGCLGELHPGIAEELQVPRCFVFELDFEGLIQYSRPAFKARPLPRYPSVERDLSIVVDQDFPARRIVDWIKGLKHSLIEDVQVFDQYQGAPIPEGKKSLGYSICYRAEDRTLTDDEVNALHRSLIDRISEAFGAELRH